MRRILVVANQTLGGEHLRRVIQDRLSAGPAQIHILVPATPPREHATWTEGQAIADAQARLAGAMTAFAEIAPGVTGEVGAAKPLDAIRDCALEEQFDEVVLSTLPPGVSRWLKQDLQHRIERELRIPVTHVVAKPEPAHR